MQQDQTSDLNKTYLTVVIVLTVLLPVLGFVIEHFARGVHLTFELFCKWFIFSAVGLRLFIAGLKQAIQPAFTANEIFHIINPDVFPVVRELGFANLCFGLVGLVTIIRPEWRVVSAFASGIYYGIAGLQHLIRRPGGTNERFALWTDLLIFGVLVAFLADKT